MSILHFLDGTQSLAPSVKFPLKQLSNPVKISLCGFHYFSENRVFIQIPSVMMTPLSSSFYFLPSGVSLSTFLPSQIPPSRPLLLLFSAFFSLQVTWERRHFIFKWEHLRLCKIGISPIPYPGQLESSESVAQISNGTERQTLLMAKEEKTTLLLMAKKEKKQNKKTPPALWPQVPQPLWICFLSGAHLYFFCLKLVL